MLQNVPLDVQKVESQTEKARHLLSAFYLNAELIEAGNLTGANGKLGLYKKKLSRQLLVCYFFVFKRMQ